ncbi:MAG: hypothetical protein IT430_03540 [Phycisphaerales bacterium]|nr:hypothetical protein [Phycisphaerales bacterium]
MEIDFESEFGDDHYHGGSGMGKFVIGGCVLLAVLALGGFIGKMTSSSNAAESKAQPSGGLPAISLQQQMQQAAIEALHTQQQMMLDVRRQMAEAEQGYYEYEDQRRMVEFDEYGDGNY